MARHKDRDETEEWQSRSKKKREATALQELGARLAALSAERMAGLDLPEELALALAESKSIRSHEGRRRHSQYIGKLMRSVDIEPIEAVLNEIDTVSRAQAARLHELELLRERLLACESQELKSVLAEALAPRPAANSARLTALVAEARTERVENKPPRTSRRLFKYLRDTEQKEPQNETAEDSESDA